MPGGYTVTAVAKAQIGKHVHKIAVDRPDDSICGIIIIVVVVVVATSSATGGALWRDFLRVHGELISPLIQQQLL
jgi:hypothetical protein